MDFMEEIMLVELLEAEAEVVVEVGILVLLTQLVPVVIVLLQEARELIQHLQMDLLQLLELKVMMERMAETPV